MTHEYLLDCTAILLREIADPASKKGSVLRTYTRAMETSSAGIESIEWSRVDKAIRKRWAQSGLQWIKRKAWGLLREDTKRSRQEDEMEEKKQSAQGRALPTAVAMAAAVAVEPFTDEVVYQETAADVAADEARKAARGGMAGVGAKLAKLEQALIETLAQVEGWVQDGTREGSDVDRLTDLRERLATATGSTSLAAEMAEEMAEAGWKPPRHRPPELAAGDKVTVRPEFRTRYAAVYSATKGDVLTDATVLEILAVVGEGRARKFSTIVGIVPAAHIVRAKP